MQIEKEMNVWRNVDATIKKGKRQIDVLQGTLPWQASSFHSSSKA